MSKEKKQYPKPHEVFQENVRPNIMLQDATNFSSIDSEKSGFEIAPKPFSSKSKDWCRKKLSWVFVIILTAIIILLILLQYKSFNSNFLNNGKISLKSDPFTIGTVERNDVELCQGTQMKRSFPDFDYATYGYNIIYGYPLATGHDPGLTRPIFYADYSQSKQTADCRYHVPLGYHLAPDVACVTSFTSETIKDSIQFSKHLTVSAEISGGGWGVSFSASAEYKKKTSLMSASESVFVFSKAVCNYYFAKLNEESPPPLTPDFINYVKRINTKEDVHKFFDYYGTHFLTYTLFGARFIYEYKMSQTSFQKESSEDVSVAVKASYSGLFSLSGGFGMSSSSAESARNFLSKVETKTISIGAPPPSNGDTMTWASTVKETPIPVQYKLVSIENLFKEQYMKKLNFDYERVGEMIKNGKITYCQNLKARGVVDACKMVSTYSRYEDIFISGGKKYTYNENQCIERCLTDSRCYAVHHFDTNTCYLYRSNGNTATEKASVRGKSNIIIFFDNLKLFGQSFKLHNLRVKPGIDSRKILRGMNETSCYQKCQEDPICTTISVIPSAPKNDDNCWLYSEEKVSCQGSSQEACNTLKVESGSTTWFIKDD